MAASILVVEDETIVALDVQVRLRNLGFSVAGHARNGAIAIQLAEEIKPDLILMDIQLAGDIDGIETASIIRDRFDVPSVFLTAYSDQESLDRAKHAEGYGYLLKPFQERELVIAIEMALFKHDTERRIRTNRAILDTTLNTISDGVITCDTDDKILLMNRAAEQLTGWATDEAIGEKLSRVLVLKGADQDQTDRHQTDQDRITISRRDGTVFPAEIVRIPIEAQYSDVDTGDVLVFRDVTELILSRRKLIDARDAAESAARAKSQFMARMSHEFRTPLNTILGMTRLALDTTDADAAREYLQVAQNSGEAMMRLVSDLLDFAAHDTGYGRLQEELFSLTDLVQSVVRAHGLNASENGLRLALVEDPGCVDQVCGDAYRIRQILSNLLSNAIKFTPAGSVVISVSASVAGGSVRVEIVVDDTGVGIPEEQLETVFSDFTQLENPLTRSTGGAGLGLAIARRFARAMGGDIVLTSFGGNGTRATCRLVLGTAGEEDQAARGQAARAFFTGGAFAADDEVILRVIRPWLNQISVSITSVAGSDSDTSLFLTLDEYRTGQHEKTQYAKLIVVGPVGGARELEIPRPIYVEEPVLVGSIAAVLYRDPVPETPLGGAESESGSESNDRSALRMMHRMALQNELSGVQRYARDLRATGRGSELNEVCFRAILAARKGDKPGVLQILNQALQHADRDNREDLSASSDS